MEIYTFKIGDKITRVEPCAYTTGDRYNESLNLTVQGESQYSYDLVGQELTFLGIKNGGINLCTPGGSKYYLTLSDKSKAQWSEGWSYYEPVEVPEVKEEPKDMYQQSVDEKSFKLIDWAFGLLGILIVLLHYEGNHDSANFIASMIVAGMAIITGFTSQVKALYKKLVR